MTFNDPTIEAPGSDGQIGRTAVLAREVNTLALASSLALGAVIAARWGLPTSNLEEVRSLLDKFVGPAWPFFMAVGLFLLYAAGAWLVECLGLGVRRSWHGIDHALHWATEACPLVGLLTTFVSLLVALLAYSEAGPGKPETQAAFIANFALAFGSSIAGGLLSLIAFTLHRLLPQGAHEEAN